MKRFVIMGALRDLSLGVLAAAAAWLVLTSTSAWSQDTKDVAPPATPVAPAAAARDAPAQKIVPARDETAKAAFTKLDVGQRGFVTIEDVAALDGFGAAFSRADQNRDGRLNASEFDMAWGLYIGALR